MSDQGTHICKFCRHWQTQNNDGGFCNSPILASMSDREERIRRWSDGVECMWYNPSHRKIRKAAIATAPWASSLVCSWSVSGEVL
jgi:hypothetical protein